MATPHREGTCCSRGNATGNVAGGNVVDIVGMDAYDGNPGTSGIQSTYNQLVGLGKPFAEIGPDNTPSDYASLPPSGRVRIIDG